VWGVEVQLHMLTSTLDGGDWSASCPNFSNPGTPWTEGWVDLTADLDTAAKWKKKFIVPARNRIPVVQPTTESLYLLSYTGSLDPDKETKFYQICINKYIHSTPTSWREARHYTHRIKWTKYIHALFTTPCYRKSAAIHSMHNNTWRTLTFRVQKVLPHSEQRFTDIILIIFYFVSGITLQSEVTNSIGTKIISHMLSMCHLCICHTAVSIVL